MATIDDAILEVVRGAGTPDEKVKIIKELTTAAPTDRWTTRYVIWGLIAVVIVVAIGSVIILGMEGTAGAGKIPDGIIALATTALGALATYLVPPSSHTTTVMETTTPTATTPTPTTDQIQKAHSPRRFIARAHARPSRRLLPGESFERAFAP